MFVVFLREVGEVEVEETRGFLQIPQKRGKKSVFFSSMTHQWLFTDGF